MTSFMHRHIKPVLIALVCCHAQNARADKLYVLDKDLGEFAVSLIIHDDATFEVSGTTKYGSVINVVTIAYGYYQLTDSTLVLNDALWGNGIKLVKHKEMYQTQNYLVTEGFSPFKTRTFLYRQTYPHTLSDTNMVTTEAIRAVRAQRLLKDSIGENLDLRSHHQTVAGDYENGQWKISLLKNGSYAFSLKNELIQEGTWYQNEQYLYLSGAGNTSYLCEVLTPASIVSIYMPVLSDPKTFSAKKTGADKTAAKAPAKQ